MATVYRESVAEAGFQPTQGFTHWFSRRTALWTANRRRTREIQELARFTDRDLWDVGLSRSDLMALEKGSYRRD